MGFFKRLADLDERERLQEAADKGGLSPEDQVRYLQLSVQRMDLLFFACNYQIAELPVGHAGAYGQPVDTSRELAPAVAVVENVLQQDRSMYAWVARTALRNLKGLVDLRFEGNSWTDRFSIALQSIGLDYDMLHGVSLRNDLLGQLPDHAQDCLSIAALFIDMLFVLDASAREKARETNPQAVETYNSLFASSEQIYEQLAHAMTAWSSTIIARSEATGLIPHTAASTAREFRTPPRMTSPGWYPNPFNRGTNPRNQGMSRLVPKFERYWDGEDWTERFRAKDESGSWDKSIQPMRTVPPN